jgi:hypothetical protein
VTLIISVNKLPFGMTEGAIVRLEISAAAPMAGEAMTASRITPYNMNLFVFFITQTAFKRLVS